MGSIVPYSAALPVRRGGFLTSRPQLSPSSQGLVIELRPRGQLRSVVYTHQVADHDCWTFISDGFAALGQKEIVITVLKEQDAPRPESPPQYFEILFSQVQTGKFVNDFDMAIFSDFQFLGGSHFIAFVHTTPTPLGNFPLPEKYLQAIALTKPEVDVVMRYGALRFLSHLGGSVRYFPYPPWIDAHRKTVITMNDFSESLLNFLPFNDVMGVQAVKVGEDVHAYMSSKATEVLAQQLGLDSVAVLPCNPVEDADSCLLWRNGQSSPSAIGTCLNRTNLCFLCFCPLPESEFLLEFREDGYILILSHSDFERVRDSIRTRRPITLLTKAGNSFHLHMKQDMYHDHTKDRVYLVPCHT